MSDILSRVAESRRHVVPASVDDFVGLQVCRALHDESNAYDYRTLARRTNPQTMLRAFRTVKAQGASAAHALPFFEAALSTNPDHEASQPTNPRIAVALERRRVALAVFHGLHLEHTYLRVLPSSLEKAQLGAVAFIRWALAQFGEVGVVVEREPGPGHAALTELHRSIVSAVRETTAPLAEVSARQLIESFAEPACKTRGEFRTIVANIWPSITRDVSNRALLDAIGLGLLAQVQRHLESNIPLGARE